MQRPAERTQLAVRQILEVDTEGELNSWPQRFEARMLSILCDLPASVSLIAAWICSSVRPWSVSQALVPVELMTANGSLVASGGILS